MALNLTESIFISTDQDIDAKYRVNSTLERNALITLQKVQLGHVIYLTGTGRLELTAYPTPGSITGVIWSPIGGASLPSIPTGNMLANTSLSIAEPVAKTPGEIRAILNVADGAAPTDLTFNSNTGELLSSSGNNVVLPIASGLNRGLMLGIDKNKLDGIAINATANDTNSNLLARINHTGTQLAATVSDFASASRSVILTGLSLVSNVAVIASDSILIAIGKLQSQIDILLGKIDIKSETIYIDGTVSTFEIPFNGLVNATMFEADFTNEIESIAITVRLGGSTSYDTAGLSYITTDGINVTSSTGTSSSIADYSALNTGYKYLVATVTMKAAWTYSTAFKFKYKQL